MCGRFSLYDDDRVDERFDADRPSGIERWRTSWNIAPTQQIVGVRQGRHGRHERQPPDDGHGIHRGIDLYRWGLLGPWVTDPAKAGSTFNARAETVATKPTFRAAFRTRRLIVPANSYFEWRRSGSTKQPEVVHRADGDLLAFAGLWQEWHHPADKTLRLLTATILTTTAGPDTSDLHDRQPVVLPSDLWDEWLDPSCEDVATLHAMLTPSRPGTLVHYPVDTRVGNVRNNDAGLVAPLVP